MVIFGAAGDLTKRLVVPALYNLSPPGGCPTVSGSSASIWPARRTEDWRQGLTEMMHEFVAKAAASSRPTTSIRTAWNWLTERMSYCRAICNDPATYERLGEHLAELDKTAGTGGNYLFYLAVADRFFGVVVDELGAAGLATGKRRAVAPRGDRKAVRPRPRLGQGAECRDPEALQEHQIYRIDHFLGKETVQNIMALRFANGLFEPMWNREHIDHVQITAAETVGVERRGKFYEKTGALRDMVPNHLFQLLAMTAMEPPNSFDAEAVRAKKAEVIQAIRPLTPARRCSDAVRGQYGAGTVWASTARPTARSPTSRRIR